MQFDFFPRAKVEPCRLSSIARGCTFAFQRDIKVMGTGLTEELICMVISREAGEESGECFIKTLNLYHLQEDLFSRKEATQIKVIPVRTRLLIIP